MDYTLGLTLLITSIGTMIVMIIVRHAMSSSIPKDGRTVDALTSKKDGRHRRRTDI